MLRIILTWLKLVFILKAREEVEPQIKEAATVLLHYGSFKVIIFFLFFLPSSLACSDFEINRVSLQQQRIIIRNVA